MLLVHVVLSLAEVWQHREKVEHEAAAQFHRLAGELRVAGVPRRLVDMAGDACEDETEHASMCRRLVEHLEPGLAPLPPEPVGALGPAGLSPGQRALYASVALSCVTETFSTALLIEMQRLATDPLVAETVHRILRDEVNHSRLGWAHLAWVAEREDVTWLGPYLGDMVRASLRGDLPTAAPDADRNHPGQGLGVLSMARVHDIAASAMKDVILPGFARYRIAPFAA